ncbi:hypothetical protein ACFX2C_026511 [Malus domestica]|uniref:putative cyclic nucleotide-gated ion channel 13 n=1 Tax=Malus domestica TaxID=3750 RepID=UPI0010AB0419|nr:putative cyclic nucleotide-gated ion channel 13 [Malus domestica]XP_028944338.1 putative cyclic nucleotide-gated ion channel 13 [Malus domestica]
MEVSIITISDQGHRNTSDEGEASKEDRGHKSRTTAELPPTEPPRHQPFFPNRDIIFILASAFSLFIDPLVCYIVVIVKENNCFIWDQSLTWIFFSLRTIGDLFYGMDIVVSVMIFRSKTKLRAKSSAGVSSTKTTDDHRIFKHKRSVKFSLAILLRIWLALPVIQVILISLKYTPTDATMIILLIPVQYTLRAYNLYEWLNRRANVETGIRRLLSVLLDLLPFTTASHLYGSMWYIFAVIRELECWRAYVCKHETICDIDRFYSYFYCGRSSQKNNLKKINVTTPRVQCSVELQKTTSSFAFDYGIYQAALQSNLASSRDYPRKIFHCFWWGLRNLSSFGSNLQTSFFLPEIIFSVMISISGLALFLVYLNSRVNQGLEKIAEQSRLRQKMKMTYSVLIKQTRTTCPLRMSSLNKVPILGSTNEKGLKAISEYLKLEIYTRDMSIIREGEPLRKMLFIRQGTALTYTTSKGKTRVCKCLEKNDFYGEELLIWAFKVASFPELPICTTTIVSQSKVEAFSITANHLKSIIAEVWWHFKRELPHSQVEYFAASSIQVVWRAHHAKKAKRSTGWDK